MDRIIDAVMRLQVAFEVEGLSAPGIVLGDPGDLARIYSKLNQRDLIFDGTKRSVRPSIAGTKLYEPYELRQERPQPMTATLSRSRLTD